LRGVDEREEGSFGREDEVDVWEEGERKLRSLSLFPSLQTITPSPPSFPLWTLFLHRSGPMISSRPSVSRRKATTISLFACSTRWDLFHTCPHLPPSLPSLTSSPSLSLSDPGRKVSRIHPLDRSISNDRSPQTQTGPSGCHGGGEHRDDEDLQGGRRREFEAALAGRGHGGECLYTSIISSSLRRTAEPFSHLDLKPPPVSQPSSRTSPLSLCRKRGSSSVSLDASLATSNRTSSTSAPPPRSPSYPTSTKLNPFSPTKNDACKQNSIATNETTSTLSLPNFSPSSLAISSRPSSSTNTRGAQ